MEFLRNKTSRRPLRGRLYKIADRYIRPGQTVAVPDGTIARLEEESRRHVFADLEVVSGPAGDDEPEAPARPVVPPEAERISNAAHISRESPRRRRS